ncbi:MAG: hypothetical protein DPW09_13790 [Anaerolineae bacterium]|nr:hypothetical protein [Anaerolineales bacterium]MCQ3974509.1 hypothetical protein [Anaerolineae bacterium]
MAKRTRRERRLEGDKQPGQFVPKTAPAGENIPLPTLSEEFVPTPAMAAQAAPLNNRKTAAVNFAQEYYYEYGELRTILIITAILVVAMVGMSFVI